MKRSIVLLLGIALVTLVGIRPAVAEPVVFQGKSVCLDKCTIAWPFSTETARVVKHDKGVHMAVSVQPEPPSEEKSGVAKGSPMRYLHILEVKAEVGQKVNGGDTIMTYETPMDQIISEREHLSSAKVDNLAHQLAAVNSLLEKLDIQQQELDQAATSIKTVSPGVARIATQNYEALLKKRDALALAYEDAKAHFDNDLQIAHDQYGRDVNALDFPKKQIIGACVTGYILWKNTSCLPGVVLTKETKLVSIGQLDPILVQAAVHEIAAHKLHIGDPATITFRSLPGRTYNSTITKIDYMPQSGGSQDLSYYQVEMSVANQDISIKEGMRCDVTVDVPAGR